jgi:hypothetical protein
VNALHANVGDGGVASEASLGERSDRDKRDDEDEDQGIFHLMQAPS